MVQQPAEKILAPEIAKLERKDQVAAADQICKQWNQFEILLPEKARDNIQYFAVSAVKYIRRHIPDPFTPESFVDAVFDGARYGLAIDGRLAHALPFADKAQGGAKNLVFVPDYKGMIYVAKNRELVRDVRPYVVHECDEFQAPGESSDGEYSWSYRPNAKAAGAAIGAICVLEFMDGRKKCEWMTEEDIRKIRNSAKTDKIWKAWPDEMRKKSVIRRAFKLHQDDPVLAALMADDDASYSNDVIEVAPKKLTLPVSELADIDTGPQGDTLPDAKDPASAQAAAPAARRRRKKKAAQAPVEPPPQPAAQQTAPAAEAPQEPKQQPQTGDPFAGVAAQQARAEEDAKRAASAGPGVRDPELAARHAEAQAPVNPPAEPEPLGPTPGDPAEPTPGNPPPDVSAYQSPAGESLYQELFGYAEANQCAPEGWKFDDEGQLTLKEIGDRILTLKRSLGN